jgi:hypothetical protein
MYLGPRTPPPTKDGHGIQYIFFDSEGINGSNTTVTKKFFRNLVDQTFRIFFGYAKNKNDSTMLSNDNCEAADQDPKEKEHLGERMKHVQESYPKLLYLFGDVLLFVTTHNWREKQTVNEAVLTWARTAGGGAVDHGVKPKLIIIFNKVTVVK